MKLRTEIDVIESDFKIGHQDKILALGSCFADCIGNKLNNNKFNILRNPFGTIFNPLAICNLLEKSINLDNNFNIIQSQGIWQAYECHSELGSAHKEDLIKNLNLQTQNTHNQIINSKILIITLGTAIVYNEKSLGISVANCHKIPAAHFNKTILSSSEIVTQLTNTIQLIKTQNREIKIILTVSPVRHIKETLVLNSVSKSILRVACHELASNNLNIHYFPAYEFMMDDLRDYRFYKDDLIHPNSTAETYIWNKFMESYFIDKTKNIVAKWDKLSKALSHKPFFPESDQYQIHLKETLKKLNELSSDLDLADEIQNIQTLIGEKS